MKLRNFLFLIIGFLMLTVNKGWGQMPTQIGVKIVDNSTPSYWIITTPGYNVYAPHQKNDSVSFFYSDVDTIGFNYDTIHTHPLYDSLNGKYIKVDTNSSYVWLLDSAYKGRNFGNTFDSLLSYYRDTLKDSIVDIVYNTVVDTEITPITNISTDTLWLVFISDPSFDYVTNEDTGSIRISYYGNDTVLYHLIFQEHDSLRSFTATRDTTATIYPNQQTIKKYLLPYSISHFSSISQLKTENILFYPNPANSKLNIISKNENKISIFNSLGEKVLESNLQEIDVSKFNNGTYYVMIGNKIRKLIIQH